MHKFSYLMNYAALILVGCRPLVGHIGTGVYAHTKRAGEGSVCAVDICAGMIDSRDV
jgi:hypothetical protein